MKVNTATLINDLGTRLISITLLSDDGQLASTFALDKKSCMAMAQALVSAAVASDRRVVTPAEAGFPPTKPGGN